MPHICFLVHVVQNILVPIIEGATDEEAALAQGKRKGKSKKGVGSEKQFEDPSDNEELSPNHKENLSSNVPHQSQDGIKRQEDR